MQNELISMIIEDIDYELSKIDVLLEEKNKLNAELLTSLVGKRQGLIDANNIVGKYYIEEAETHGDW